MIEPKLSPKPLEDLEVSEDDEDLFEDPLEELSTAAQVRKIINHDSMQIQSTELNLKKLLCAHEGS